MITPLEIETKDFSKSMRGYNPVEVDDFLDIIIEDMEKLLDERNTLKQKISNLEKEVADLTREVEDLNCEIGEHKKTEASVMNTLDSAKVLMQDISVSAEKRADIIIRNAKLDAELILKDAKESIQKMGEECSLLREKSKAFRQKYRDMLEDELKRINESEENLFEAFDGNFDFEIDNIFKEELPSISSEDEELKLEDLIEDLSPVKREELTKQDSSEDGLDRHTALMSELTSVFDSGKKAHNIPSPKATVALDSADIDELLKKEDAKRRNADKNTVVL